MQIPQMMNTAIKNQVANKFQQEYMRVQMQLQQQNPNAYNMIMKAKQLKADPSNIFRQIKSNLSEEQLEKLFSDAKQIYGLPDNFIEQVKKL